MFIERYLCTYVALQTYRNIWNFEKLLQPVIMVWAMSAKWQCRKFGRASDYPRKFFPGSERSDIFEFEHEKPSASVLRSTR